MAEQNIFQKLYLRQEKDDAFDYGGYTYSEEHTESPLSPVFIR